MTTSYTLEGSSVIKETNGTDTLWYYYDAGGAVTSFELNGTPYYYVKNLQGDIIAITDASGNKVVEYVYNSWGKLISISGSLASTVGVKNPYRYRGYRYDTELGLYYLQSRYYDPEMKRFVNADAFVSTGQGIIGNNRYAYCLNNPIMYADQSGNSIILACIATGFIVGAIVGGTFGWINAAVNGTDVTRGVLVGALSGAIIGAVAAAVPELGISVGAQFAIPAVTGAVVAGTADALTQKADYMDIHGTDEGFQFNHAQLAHKTATGSLSAVIATGYCMITPMTTIPDVICASIGGGIGSMMCGSIELGVNAFISEMRRLSEKKTIECYSA